MLTEREIDDLEEFCLNYTEPTKNQNFFIVKTSYRIENLISDWRELKRQNQTLQTNLADLAEDYKEFRSQNQTLKEKLGVAVKALDKYVLTYGVESSKAIIAKQALRDMGEIKCF
jgi:cell shape-determining protein MreC